MFLLGFRWKIERRLSLGRRENVANRRNYSANSIRRVDCRLARFFFFKDIVVLGMSVKVGQGKRYVVSQNKVRFACKVETREKCLI